MQASGGKADCLWIGATTPGSTSTQFTLTEFQLWQESNGYGERYIAIATANATSSLNATDVVAVSNNCINPSASQLYTYTFDSEVTLNGGTTYYIVFLSSNTPTDGAYPVARGRLALNHQDYGAYTPGYRTSTGMQANWWPYYKAELTPSVPVYDVSYKVVDGSNNVLFTSETVSVISGTAITELPAAYQKADFYSYNTVDVTVTSNQQITFTATPLTTPLVKYSADADNATWYYLTMRPGGDNTAYPTYVASPNEGDENVQLPATDAHDETTMWAFVGEPYAGFHVYNKAAGTGVVLGSALAGQNDNNGGNTPATLAALGSQTYEIWTISASSYATGGFFLSNAEGQYLNKRNANNLSYWTKGHDIGSTFVGEEHLEGQALYESLLAQVEATNYGTVLGTYTCSLCPGTEADYINNIKTTYGAAANYTEGAAALQTMIDAISINLPKANTFLRIQSTHGTYLSGIASTSSNGATGRLTFTTAEDASTAFFFDGTYFYCLGTGAATKGRDVGVVGTAGIAYSFEESTITPGRYAIRFNPDEGVLRYMYAWGTSGAKTNMADQNGADAANCVFTLTELTSVPFTISAAGQATICLPVAFTVPTGVKVRYANRAHDNLLTVVECGTDEGVAALPVVPANTPVILVGAAGTYDLALAETDATVTGNVLTSTSNGGVAVAAETNAYILALNGTEVVFAKLDDTDRNIAGFKAYFVLETGGDAPQYLFFEEGEVTGINAVNAAVQNGAAVYDLQGRRVNAATKGVYIINGKKVLVK